MNTDITAYNRQYRRDQRRQWRTAGRCASCGATRDRASRVTCGACIDAAAQRSRYWKRRAAGLCVRCGQTAAPGAAHCNACRPWERDRCRDQYAALRDEHAAYVQHTGRRLTLTAYQSLRRALHDAADTNIGRTG